MYGEAHLKTCSYHLAMATKKPWWKKQQSIKFPRGPLRIPSKMALGTCKGLFPSWIM
jgi:hypothetical protein